MNLKGRNPRQTQVLLLSLVALMVPLFLFPHRFGTGLARASLIYLMFELAFYMVAVYALTRRASILPLAQAAGICVIYRLVMGAAFGLFIALGYSMNLKAALTLGMSSYLPAVLLHIAAAPFILMPVLMQLVTARPHSAAGQREREETESPMMDGKTTAATSARRGRPAVITPYEYRPEPERPARADADIVHPRPGEGNGFERATRYIGEDASVFVAAVVDRDGLLLGHFQRGKDLAEEWAPLARLFYEQNQQVVDRFTTRRPERITLRLNDRKITIARDESFYLMVVADRHNDEMLNIRFSQALEIVRKYVAERYGNDRAMNTENAYVRSAQ